MERPTTVALLYLGDCAVRDRANPRESRFVAALFDAFMHQALQRLVGCS